MSEPITFGQFAAQYRKNAKTLREMAKKALEKGRAVNGYTATELRRMAADSEDRAAECEARAIAAAGVDG